MTQTLDFVLDHLNTTLLIFFLGATLARPIVSRPILRILAGAAFLGGTLVWHISTRSAYDWSVSALERTSAPGLLLLCALIYSAVAGRLLVTSAEFRFGTLVLIIAGLILYPGAIGMINADTYVAGYSGYLLPSALAANLAYAVYRRFNWTVVALNAGIVGFLLGAGRSLNLWDYLVDPIACLLALISWLAILVSMLPFFRVAGEKALRPEPS